MFHLDNASGVSVMPPVAVEKNGSPKWFTESGTPSYPGADWFNIVQAELLNVLSFAGIAPVKTAFDQLARAIERIALNASTFPAYTPLPCPLDVAPPGFTFCHGQLFDTKACPMLFYAYPTGRLPDFRGMTMKGASDGRPALSYEPDQNKRQTIKGETDTFSPGPKLTEEAGDHFHTCLSQSSGISAAPSTGAQISNATTTQKTSVAGNHAHIVVVDPHFHTLEAELDGGDEVTVKNIAVNWMVRLA